MQKIHPTMGIQDYSSINTNFMFPPPSSSSPSSQIPLIMQHHHQSSFNHVLPTENRLPPPSPTSFISSYGGLYKRVVNGLQFANYESSSTTTSQATDHHLGFHGVQPGSDPFKIQTEAGKMTAQDIADAKSIAASKSHSEAERRRRERINNHLTKLRSLLPNTTKTDKASLLAEVIQHLKELRCQTSVIAEQIPIPSEIDELTIDNTSDEEGRIVIRASLCCEDRSDLLQDLINTLKMLRLRTLKAEITTLGRRVKNVLFVTGEDHHSDSSIDNQQVVNHYIPAIEEALRAIVEKTNDGDDSSFVTTKRQKNK